MADKAILYIFLVRVRMCVDLSEPVLPVKIQRVSDDLEGENPGISRAKGVIA